MYVCIYLMNYIYGNKRGARRHINVGTYIYKEAKKNVVVSPHAIS